MALDEQLKRELERAARPADPSGVYEDLIRRRERARIRRRVSAGVIAFVVFAGGVLGLFALSRTLEDTGGQPATYGPLTGRILFTDIDPSRAIPDTTGGWVLTSMAPDGTDVVDLHPEGLDEVLYPTASPDGSRIAFLGFVVQPESRSVYVMNADGTELESVLELDHRHQVEALAWSPDNARIGLVISEFTPTEPPPEAGARDLDQASTVWTMATDGSDLVQITTTGRERALTWSPDGTRLAFDRYEPIDAEATGGSDIFVVNADGSGEVRLTTDGRSSEPAWSPDGSTIAFSRSTGEGNLDLFLMDPDGSNVRPLTSAAHYEMDPAWAPDAQAIVFAQTTESDDHSNCQISTIRPDGSEHRLLTAHLECPSTNGLWWSPTPPLAEGETGSTGATGDTGAGSEEPPVTVGPVSLCDPTSVTGTFLAAYPPTEAVVGTLPLPDGTCGTPNPEGGAEGVAVVDVTGDGSLTISSDPFPCQGWCSAFAAPDVDGDGNDELLVKNVEFTVPGLLLLDVIPSGESPALVAVTVEPPGDPNRPGYGDGSGGFDGEGLPQFWIGGDGFSSDGLRCEPSSGGRVLVSSSATMDPPDSADAIWDVHETTFRLEFGVLHVVDVRDYEETIESDVPPSFRDTGGCGADIEPYD